MRVLARYGDIPEVADCIDLGKYTGAPSRVDNALFSSNQERLIEVFGEEIPVERRCWLAVSAFRGEDIPRPYRVEIPGLGTLLVGEGENWGLVKF